MNYTKPPLDFEGQADRLIGRGLSADRAVLVETLKRVSYYRLSGYLYPFRRRDGSERYRDGTCLDEVWDRYVFDRQLRVLVLDAIERVEVAVKTRLVTGLTLRHGSFAHLDRANFPNMRAERHRRLRDKIDRQTDHSREPFVTHYRGKYTAETRLPLWMAAEIMDYGCMLTMFRGAEGVVKQEIARTYGVSDRVLESWLVAGNTLRNLCAHHGRLWDRVHGTAVMIPRRRKNPEWHDPVNVGAEPRKNYAQLTVLRHLLRHIAPQSRWAERLEALWTEKHPAIDIRQMGFPGNWKDCPVWRSA